MCSFLASKNNELSFRAVELKDRELLFQWRNIPEIVALSASQQTVSWLEHVTWFEDFILDDSILILIITYEEKPIGQIRLNKEDDKSVNIGVYLIPSEVGKKRGSYLINKAVAFATKTWPNIRYLKEEVRVENKRSIKSFEAVGFRVSHEGVVAKKHRIIFLILDLELWK